MKIAMARLDLCPPGKCPDGLRDVGAFGRIYGYPSAVVLDAAGIVRAKMKGYQVLDVEAAILKVLDK